MVMVMVMVMVSVLCSKTKPISMFGAHDQLYGAARVGCRAVAARYAYKGQNLHIIGAIEQLDSVYYTIRQGSLKKEDFLQWLQELVNACEIKGIAHSELAVVIYNAPAHCKAQKIVEANPGV